MLPQRLTAVLLSVPLLAMIFVSVRCWIEFGKEERRVSGKQYISYNKFFLTLVAIGYFGIWPFWVGGIVFVFLNRYSIVFGFMTFSVSMA